MTKRPDSNHTQLVAHGLRAGACIALAGAIATSLTGCTEEPPPPVVVAPPPPPPPPPPPAVTSIEELMAKLNIDPRIRWSEDRAPKWMLDGDREAVLGFVDAFARGDSARLKPLLSPLDQYELDILVENGQFESATGKIRRIDIRTGKSTETPSKPCVLAVYDMGERYEAQLWTYASSPLGYQFEAVATPPNIMTKLSGDDWVTAWFELLKSDLELANKPDENPIIPQTNRSATEDNSGGGSGPAGFAPVGAPSDPGPGPGAPSKRKPGTPIKPPRPGFGQ